MMTATYSVGLNNMFPSDMQFKQAFICEALIGLFTNFFATFLFEKFFAYVKVRCEC